VTRIRDATIGNAGERGSGGGGEGGTTRPELSSEFRGRLRRGFPFQDVGGEQRSRSAIRLLRAHSQRSVRFAAVHKYASGKSDGFFEGYLRSSDEACCAFPKSI